MQLNPARGRKLEIEILVLHELPPMVYAAQPREGTETRDIPILSCPKDCRFMQLNPARGRKQEDGPLIPRVFLRKVYAAQPREGTETYTAISMASRSIARFMQLNPARGRKLIQTSYTTDKSRKHGLCSSTPRGDGNQSLALRISCASSIGLCSSTPRGDGNL